MARQIVVGSHLAQTMVPDRIGRKRPPTVRLGSHAKFIIACQAVGQLLAAHGFEPTGNGKPWKKTAADRDTTFEVSFQPGSYNTRSKVEMTVHIHIASG